MIGFNHVLSGALVGIFTPTEYAIYIPLIAFVSHFLLDAFPHYGHDETASVYSQKFKRILVVDAILCVLFLVGTCWLYPDKLVAIVIAVAFATLPDFLWILHYYVKTKNRGENLFFKFAAKIQWGERPWAWSLEILYAMIMIALLVGLS